MGKTRILILLVIMATNITAQITPSEVRSSIDELNAIIDQAKSLGIDTYKDETVANTANIFLKFSIWDENNIAENTEYFDRVPIYQDSAAAMAELLPEFERSEILLMLEDAKQELQEVIVGNIRRLSSPRVNWAEVIHNVDHLTYEDEPVFINDYTWKPNSGDITPFHGELDGFFISPTQVINSQGQISSNTINDLNNKPSGTAGFVFISNKAIPDWALTEYGHDFLAWQNGFNFTKYDIDNPGARHMMGSLLDGTVPLMAGKKYIDLGYILCNEPHFFTQSGVWASDGVSDFTHELFRQWLKDKHQDIANLNSIWNEDFDSFDAVNLIVPINGNLQGSPQWYDWCLFNMYRVIEYYTFMKDRIKNSDPNAKVHLKIMPRLWSDNAKDHGIDFEALTEISDIIGNDAGAWNNIMWGSREWWQDHYSFNYREVAMGYDFMKSVSPDKMAFNSESHYLSKNRSRNLYQKPTYARATYWLAYTLGESASQTWYWARNEDGSVRNNVGVGYAGSNNHQPRIVNEVAATMIDLNSHAKDILAIQRQRKPLRIYYSKTSAINDGTHMDKLFDLYNSMFFDGVSLGFATDKILKKQDHSQWEALLIYSTERVTISERESLQAYLDQGGIIIMDNESILKDEYGADLPPLIANGGRLILADNLSSMSSEAMSILETSGDLPLVTVTESNANNIPGVHWKYITREDGSHVLSLSNLGNTTATIELKLNEAAEGTNVLNLLNGVYIDNIQELEKDDVLFVQITDEEPITGVIEVESSVIEVIYPNPTTGWVRINLSKKHNVIVVGLFNISGPLVQKNVFRDTTSFDIDMSNLVTGTYVVHIKIGDEILTKKVIKY